jgi:hypothetical protein
VTARRGGAVLPAVAAALVLAGGMVGAPEAGLAASGLAAVAALLSLRGAARTGRVVAALLLALSLALAASLAPAAARRWESYTGSAPRPGAPRHAPPRRRVRVVLRVRGVRLRVREPRVSAPRRPCYHA